MAKAEMGVTQPQAKDFWPPPESRREAWDGFSLGSCRRNQPCSHLDFGLVVSWTMSECLAVVLSHLVCGHLYGIPRKLTKCNSRIKIERANPVLPLPSPWVLAALAGGGEAEVRLLCFAKALGELRPSGTCPALWYPTREEGHERGAQEEIGEVIS